MTGLWMRDRVRKRDRVILAEGSDQRHNPAFIIHHTSYTFRDQE
jgi:hypothetical protein